MTQNRLSIVLHSFVNIIMPLPVFWHLLYRAQDLSGGILKFFPVNPGTNHWLYAQIRVRFVHDRLGGAGIGFYSDHSFMSWDVLIRLRDEVGPEHSLLICCSTFRCDAGQFINLTVNEHVKNILEKKGGC